MTSGDADDATDRPGPRTRLVVVFGGQSAEHDVSLVTARHVLAATDPNRYDIAPVGITRSGQWVLAEDATRALAKGPDALPDALDASGPATEPLPAIAGAGEIEPDGRVVVFPLLHGPLGEDGTIQGLLELAGIPFVGCGVLASALAMDKAKAKEVFAFNGIPQARWVVLHESELRDLSPSVPGPLARIAGRGAGETDATSTIPTAVLERLEALGYPLFVKPANMGSSVGVTKAHDRDELTGALILALRYDEWIVVEETVVGREIECAVLGNLDPRTSVPGEIVAGAEFYDYEDKYSSGTAELIIPADLPSKVTAELQELAINAFKALRCEGMARVDFFYEPDGRGLLVNEINTIPGFTPISMYPKLWEASGMPYADLIDELIRLALERYDRRAARRETS